MTMRYPEPAAAQQPFNDSRPSLLTLMLDRRIAWAAFKVSLVVGTVLNLINNGERLWMHQDVSLWHAALNFAVPFCVSSYSAARNEARRFVAPE